VRATAIRIGLLLNYRLLTCLMHVFVVHFQCVLVLFGVSLLLLLIMIEIITVFRDQRVIKYFLWGVIFRRVSKFVLGVPRVPLDQVDYPSQQNSRSLRNHTQVLQNMRSN
jgi:hypothetical protein